MEETPLLLPMQRVIGRIQIEYDLLGGLLMRLEKEVHHEGVDLARIQADLLVAAGSIRIERSQLQSIQRALASQSLAPVPAPLSLLPLQVALASHKAEERVMAEIVMVIQVLVPASQTQRPLGYQLFDRMLDPILIPEILEAIRKAAEEVNTIIDLAQKQDASVRADVASIETSFDFSSKVGLKWKLALGTLCVHLEPAVFVSNFFVQP